MRKFITLLFLGSLLAGWGAVQSQETVNSIDFGDDGVVYLEDFQKYPVGSIPDEWYNRDGDNIPATYDEPIKSEYKYRVEQENSEKFLRFEGVQAKHLNFPLKDKEELNILENPVLKWQWRIHDIPEGGDEDSSSMNDVAASVYVVFDTSRILFQQVPVSIRYTWSSKHPEGSVFSKLRGRQQIVVVGTGENKKGEWQTFERNLVEDYKKLFGKTPPKTPIALLILSDSDDSRSFTKADYNNFELHPE
ncbi:MAG: DUF3047 domain-containing protein [Balneolaceae bacterium]